MQMPKAIRVSIYAYTKRGYFPRIPKGQNSFVQGAEK